MIDICILAHITLYCCCDKTLMFLASLHQWLLVRAAWCGKGDKPCLLTDGGSDNQTYVIREQFLYALQMSNGIGVPTWTHVQGS